MAQRVPDGRSLPRTTAVVQVAEDGAAKLYLGTELVEHAAGVDAAAVMRVLVDYAASIDLSVRVTTQMPDGTWTRHRLYSDGTITPLPRNLPPASTVVSSVGSAEAPRSQRLVVWTRIRNRAAQGWLLATLILLGAALVAVLVTT
jgi:hypothetical protein